MADLSLLEREVLEILKQLQFCCDRFELHNKAEKEGSGIEVEILADDIKTNSIFEEREHIVTVAKHLESKGLDFTLTEDFLDNLVSGLSTSVYKGGDYATIGIIKGKNIRDIKTKIEELINELSPKESIRDAGEDKNNITGKKKGLKSIHLVTESVAVKDVIFMVLDERYEMPIRFNVKNHDGKDASIKKLHDIVYIANVLGKKVDYSKKTADNINNGLFKKRQVKEYMETNNFKSPTLVQKSGNILVSKNDILVEMMVIDKVPSQYQKNYRDKTR